MKIEQVRAKIQKGATPEAPLDGEVVHEAVVSQATVDDYGRTLLGQVRDLLLYMSNDKLSSVIEPVDRKEMRTLANEIRIYLHVTNVVENDLNVGGCKQYVRTSCLKNKLSENATCSACKRFKLHKKMAELGVIPEGAELTANDIRVLENMDQALSTRVDI